MALTEEQKQKLREKAAQEVAVRNLREAQKREEEEFYIEALKEEELRQGGGRNESAPGLMVNNMQSNHQTNVLWLKIICSLFALSIGLSPMFSYLYAVIDGTTISMTLTQNNAWISVVCIALFAILFIWVNFYGSSIISGIAGLVFFFLKNNEFSQWFQDEDSLPRWVLHSFIQHGIGYYMVLVGSIGLIIFSILAYEEKKKVDPKTKLFPLDGTVRSLLRP